MPGLGRADRARLALRLHLARTPRSTSTPTRSRRGRSTRPGSTPPMTSGPATAPSARAPRCARCSGSTTGSTSTSPTRTPISSPAFRPAWRRRAGSPARWASARPASRGSPTTSAGAGGRGVTAPARTAADARERILEAACDVIAEHGIDDVRIARIAIVAGVSPALVHYHFATRDGAAAEALEHSFELLGDVRTTSRRRRGLDRGADARLDDRPVAPVPGHGRPRVAAVARAVGPGGATAGAARRSPRSSTRATTSGSPRWSRTASPPASSARPTPRASSQRLIAAIDGLGLRVLVDDPAMAGARARG